MDRPTASELIHVLDQFLRNVVEVLSQSLPQDVQDKISAGTFLFDTIQPSL